MIWGTSSAMIPEYQYQIFVRDAAPQWRLCGANIGYYDKLNAGVQIGVEFEPNKSPNVKLLYNYVAPYSYDSRVSSCQCGTTLAQQGKATNAISTSFGSNQGATKYWNAESFRLCTNNGNAFNGFSSNYNSGIGGTILTDPAVHSKMIVYIGDSFTTLEVGESKAVRVALSVSEQSGSYQYQANIVGEQSFGTGFGCVQTNVNGNLIANSYDIRFNKTGSVPCLRIIPETKVIYINDGMNSTVLFFALVSFVGGIMAVIVSCFGTISHAVREYYMKPVDSSSKIAPSQSSDETAVVALTKPNQSEIDVAPVSFRKSVTPPSRSYTNTDKIGRL